MKLITSFLAAYSTFLASTAFSIPMKEQRNAERLIQSNGTTLDIQFSNYQEAGTELKSDRLEIRTYVLDGKVVTHEDCDKMRSTFQQTFTNELNEDDFYIINGFSCTTEGEGESMVTEMVYLLHLEPKKMEALPALMAYLSRKQDIVLWGSTFHFWKSLGVFMGMSLIAGDVQDDPTIPGVIHIVNPLSVERFEDFLPNLGALYGYLNDLTGKFDTETFDPVMKYLEDALGTENAAEYAKRVLTRAQGVQWDPRPRMILENSWLNTPAHWLLSYDCRLLENGHCRS